MAPDYIDTARKALENGNFEEVQRLEREGRIPQSQIDLLSNNVFVVQCNRKNYAQAVKLGKAFRIPSDKIREAVQRYFSELTQDGHFDQAIEWGKSNELEQKDIEDAAIKFCRSCLAKGEIERALEIKKTYSLQAASLRQVAEEAFNKAFQAKEYEFALRLSQEFEVSQNKLWSIVSKTLEQYVSEKDWPKLSELLGAHHLLEERVFEGIRLRDQIVMTDLLTNKVIKDNLYADDFDPIIMFIEKSGILNRTPQNSQLAKLYHYAFSSIAEIHKTFLIRENVAEAITLSEKFRLLDSSVPTDIRESIKTIAHKYHDEMLRKGDFERASRIKKHYNLYDTDGFNENIYALNDAVMIFLENALFKADTDNALAAAKEYRISKNQVKNVVKKVVRECMDRKSFPPVFEILKQFPLPSDDNELICTAENHFDDAMQENQFALAAQLAFYFKLKKELGIKAGYRAWEKSMQYGKIDEAILLKKRHRLPIEMTGTLAKETYQHFLRTNPEMAQRIRNEFQIDLSFLEIFLEILRKILNILLPGKKTELN